MNLSTYIKGLQAVFDQYGDLPCYYAKDDEGNGYQEVGYDGTIYYVEKLEHSLDSIYSSQEEYNDEGYEDSMKLIPICIVN